MEHTKGSNQTQLIQVACIVAILFYDSKCPSTRLSVYPNVVYLIVCISVSLSFFHFVYLTDSLSFFLSAFLFVFLSGCMCISVRRFLCLSVFLSAQPSFHPSIYPVKNDETGETWRYTDRIFSWDPLNQWASSITLVWQSL